MNDKNNLKKPLKLRPDTLKGFSYVWSAKVNHTRTYAESDEPISDEGTGIHCGVCGSDKLILIYKDYYGDLTGSSGEWEYKCLECNKYTVLEKND